MAEEADTHRSGEQQEHQSLSSSPYSEGGVFVKQTQAPFGGFYFPNGDAQFLPIMYPGFLQQNQEQNYGRGLYAVAPFSFMGPSAPYPPNTLIPFTYNLPTASETSGVGEGQGQSDQRQQLQQQLQPPAERVVVVRRFQFGLRIDLLLILKLVAVMFLFNQDGSKQRLVLIGFFVSLVYLYQTGALAPLIRWLTQGMQRAAAPLQPPRPAVQADNVHAPGRAGHENPPAADGQPRGPNEDQPVDGDRAAENDPIVEHREAEGGHRWWGIVKEIQLIVFGFITSLLPGFHNID